MNWDSALIGVVVGSILSLIGNFTNHWFSMRKEEKQWERQQEVEDKKRNFEERKQRIENVRNIYHNCISHLSLIEASRSENLKISDEKMIVINQESFKWLSLLSLHQRDLYDENNNFHQQFKNFTGNPILYVPIMLKEVYKLAMSDQVLFPHAKQKERNPNLKRFYMEIDKVF
ncbi:MAG: hypothetical protein Q7U02_05515, partial [Desulfosalsimonadaceae bacterium]|nr:hypothetical protein [Desulfosalsimonadaceae bacterium]